VTLTFPKAGSSNELIGEPGSAFLNKCMSFKSGSGMSSLLINRTIEDEGGIPFASVDRKSATLGFTVTSDRAVGLIPLLATECSFEKWDVRDAQKLAAVEAEVAAQSTQVVLTESLFAAAYGPQSPAGRPFYYPNASKESIMSFRQRTYGLNGAVLAVTGVKDHSALVTEAENLLALSSVGTVESSAPLVYLGGESRIASPSAAYAHIALGFSSPSSSVLSAVLKHVITLNGSELGYSGFCSTGIVGMYAGSADSAGLLENMITALKKPLTPELIKRAKTLAKAESLLSLDSGSQVLAGAMTASVVESGTFKPAEISKNFDSIADSQVKDLMTTMLKSKPSVAAVGNISAIPYHATVVSSLAS
jgi:predicted Zn-dependent peptidase